MRGETDTVESRFSIHKSGNFPNSRYPVEWEENVAGMFRDEEQEDQSWVALEALIEKRNELYRNWKEDEVALLEQEGKLNDEVRAQAKKIIELIESQLRTINHAKFLKGIEDFINPLQQDIDHLNEFVDKLPSDRDLSMKIVIEEHKQSKLKQKNIL